MAAARKELLATRRGEERNQNAEEFTTHFVIWFNNKGDGLISGIERPPRMGPRQFRPSHAGSEAQFDGSGQAAGAENPVRERAGSQVDHPGSSSAGYIEIGFVFASGTQFIGSGQDTDTASDGQTT